MKLTSCCSYLDLCLSRSRFCGGLLGLQTHLAKWWFDYPPLHVCMWEKFVLAFKYLPYGSQFKFSFAEMPFKKIFSLKRRPSIVDVANSGVKQNSLIHYYKFRICFKKLNFTNMYSLNCILSLCSTSRNNSNFFLQTLQLINKAPLI